MPEGDGKIRATNLLRQLEGEVQELDRWHEQLLMNSATAKKFSQADSRDIITSLRKQLDSITKNY
jgi:two-component sensor histidine kinase